MDLFGRQPPSFVPTLTDVVSEALPTAVQAPLTQSAAWAGAHDRANHGTQEEAVTAAPVHPALVDVEGLNAVAEGQSAEALSASKAVPLLTERAIEPLDIAAPVREPLHLQASHLNEPTLEDDWRGLDLGSTFTASEPPTLTASIDVADATFSRADLQSLHDALVQRVLERIQPQLEAQLREVVADVVYAHADAMARNLQGAVEEVVQHAVADALAQEQIQSQLQLGDLP